MLLEGDRDAGVGDAVGEVDGAIDRVHHPPGGEGWIARGAFFTKHGGLRKIRQEDALDGLLAADIQFEFDIVGRDLVHLFHRCEVLPHDFSGGVGGFQRGG